MSRKELSYQEAIIELKAIVNLIENEEVEVDDLLQKVNRATELIKFCKNKLHGTQKEINEALEELNDLSIGPVDEDEADVN